MGNGVGPGAALDALIASLAEMGFSASASADALGRSGGNFERALVLLTGIPIICLRFHSPCYSKHDGILFLNVVCCPEGVKAIGEKYPDVFIVSCAIDEKLNEKRYIVPGLGDFGDRYYET